MPSPGILPLSAEGSVPPALAVKLHVCRFIPNILDWVIDVIKTATRFSKLACLQEPPQFRGNLHSPVSDDSMQILRAEVQALLDKGAVKKVPKAHSESGFTALIPRPNGRWQSVNHSRFTCLVARILKSVVTCHDGI